MELSMNKRIPCADCPDVIAIGEGEGICDKWDYRNRENMRVVNLFDVSPYCPKIKIKGKTKSTGAK